jgi:Aspartyl protease
MSRFRFLFKLSPLLLTFTILSVASRTQAQSAEVDSAEIRSATTDIFAHGQQSTFAFEWRQGVIFVPVRVNGSRPLSFVLDSGSARTLIDRALAKDLGLKVSGTGSLQGAGAGRIPIEFIENVSLSFPGLDSAGYELSTADLKPLQASLGAKVDGIFGYEFLRRFAVTIDYEARALTVARPQTFHASESAQALPIELRDKWAFVKAALVLPGPVTVQDSFMIDSGSSDAVDHPIVMNLQSRVATESGVGLGTPVQGATAKATALQIGRYRLADPVVSCCGATDATSKLIGNDVLKFFTVTFDYPSSQILITPNSDFGKRSGRD